MDNKKAPMKKKVMKKVEVEEEEEIVPSNTNI